MNADQVRAAIQAKWPTERYEEFADDIVLGGAPIVAKASDLVLEDGRTIPAEVASVDPEADSGDDCTIGGALL